MKTLTGLIAALVWLTCSISHAQDVTLVKPTSDGGVAIVSNKGSDSTEAQVVTAETLKKAKAESSADKPTSYVSGRKARLAVIPAVFAAHTRDKLERELYEKLGLSDPSIIENPGFTSHLVSALVNTRKVDILERDALSAIIDELDFAESDYADPANSQRMGQMINADYVVIPEIRSATFIKESKPIPFVDRIKTKYIGVLSTNIRVVEVATGRIISSSIDSTEITRSPTSNKVEQIKQSVEFVDNLYAATSLKEAANIIDVVYPIKIIAIQGVQVTLNRGKGSINVGEVLRVYNTGEELIDPDTGESLGNTEYAVGVIKVTKVNPKFSLAEVVELDEGAVIGKYDIARRKKKEAYQRKNFPSNATPPKLD